MENAQLNKHEEVVVSPLEPSVKAGVIIGLVSLVIYYSIYFIDVALLSATWLNLVMLAISIGLVIYFGAEFRKERGGFMAFGVSFQFVFIALIINSLIFTLGSILLYNVIDPNLAGVMAEAQVSNFLALMDRFGAGEAMTSDQINEMRQGIIDNYSPLGLLKGFGISLVLYAIIALILGAIIKRRDKSLDY